MTTETIPADAPLIPVEDRPFFGQPRGLAYLAFTEAWERFSYYGMTSLVVLYMVGQLLLPGHVENIAGFAGFRGFIEGLFGPMSDQALASQIFGLYTGFVYLTPVIGGWIGDRLLGTRNTVIVGALLMVGGHFAMAFDHSFLLALLLLVIGTGCLKGNISAQVGALYPVADEGGRTRGFAIFSMAINFGAIAGPLVCGLLAQLYGWHLGFGLAGVLMLMALVTYLLGYKHLPANAPKHADVEEGAKLTAAEWRTIAALVAVMGITIFQSIAYYQISNVGLVWIEQWVDLDLLGLQVPVPWFASLDPLASVICVPFLFALWRRQAAKGGEPGDIAKIATGAFLCAASNLVLMVAALTAGGGKVSILWPIAYCIGIGVAFIYYWPTLLALVSRAAPASVNSTMMGVAFCSLFIGNNIIGMIGGWYQEMGPVAFWGMHAAISGVGGLLAILFLRPLSRRLAT